MPKWIARMVNIDTKGLGRNRRWKPAAPGLMSFSLLGLAGCSIQFRSFAEVPDASYSLSDYLLGNEHCFCR